MSRKPTKILDFPTILFFVMGVLLVLLLSGCIKGEYAERASGRETWKDPETGCIYFRGTGHAGSVVSLRYRMDGTPDCPDAKAVTS